MESQNSTVEVPNKLPSRPFQPFFLPATPATHIPFYTPYIYPSYHTFPSYLTHKYSPYMPNINGIYRFPQKPQQSLTYPKYHAKNLVPNFYQYNYPDLPYEYHYLLQQNSGNIFNHQTENDITLYIPTIYG